MAGSVSAAALRVAERRLIGRVGHLGVARWAGAAAGGVAGSQADVVHALVQVLADLGAEAERRPRRTVPRLPSDLTLPDQVRVMVADLLRADAADPTLAAAQASIEDALKRLC